MKYKYRAKRPKRDQLHGMSCSELKTLLKRRGYKIDRDFFKFCVAEYKNRLYRFRWWYTNGEFYQITKTESSYNTHYTLPCVHHTQLWFV